MNGFEFTTLVVIDTDFTCSCKSNYHMITPKMAPELYISLSSMYAYFYMHAVYNSDTVISMLPFMTKGDTVEPV
jgi:hypothetical protein